MNDYKYIETKKVILVAIIIILILVASYFTFYKSYEEKKMNEVKLETSKQIINLIFYNLATRGYIRVSNDDINKSVVLIPVPNE